MNYPLLLITFIAFTTQSFAQDFSDIPMPRGFKALDLPADYGGRSLAGSLVQISPKNGFRYLGHLSDCGLPAQALAVLPSLGPDARVSQRELDLDVSLGAKLMQLFSIGFDAKRVSRVVVTLGPVVDEMVVPIAVLSAAQAQGPILRQRCGSFLKETNVFWINNALKTESLTIQLLDSSGAKITASAAQIPGVATDTSTTASVKIGGSGAIVIEKPLYIGFRDAPPFELLTGDISLFSNQPDKPPVTLRYGDEVYE